MTTRLPRFLAPLVGALVVFPVATPPRQAKLHVVASLTTYADIARQIGGDLADVVALADGAENPHFVQPRPSYVLDLKSVPERLGAGWEVATPVVFEVRPIEGGTELMVFQSGFEQLKLSIGLTEWERYRKRWREAFERLEAVLG